ncbi:MAG TPA: flagellar basal body rod protein FlgB [Polyangiaceae bacterium]|nr:flagellar basal body rod protein FlgB [Polyangiaceae bacterium]
MSGVFNSVDPLRAALDYHLDRQNVLASNVAHIDTPGYRPHDLERIEQSGFSAVMGVALQRTNERHLIGGGVDALPNGRVFEDLSAGVGNDGNYVSIDREAAKLAANQLRYDTVSAIVSAELHQLTFAASDGKG